MTGTPEQELRKWAIEKAIYCLDQTRDEGGSGSIASAVIATASEFVTFVETAPASNPSQPAEGS